MSLSLASSLSINEMLKDVWSWFYFVILQDVGVLAHYVVHPFRPLSMMKNSAYHVFLDFLFVVALFDFSVI